MSVHAEPRLDVDQHFKEITEGLTDFDPSQAPDAENRITVMLNLPYRADYGMPTIIELVYGCTFLVAVGDSVSCPPTPRGDGTWNTGVVIALDGRGYNGPVKYVRKIRDNKE